MQEDLHEELRFAVICTIVLDALVWVLSLFLLGFQMPVLAGLLLGSAGMLLNLCLLRRSILRAVCTGSNRNTLAGYLLRCLVASAVMAAGLIFPGVHIVTAFLPFLYPKMIFGILSFRQKAYDGQKNQK